jgi:hypothetical protein
LHNALGRYCFLTIVDCFPGTNSVPLRGIVQVFLLPLYPCFLLRCDTKLILVIHSSLLFLDISFSRNFFAVNSIYHTCITSSGQTPFPRGIISLIRQFATWRKDDGFNKKRPGSGPYVHLRYHVHPHYHSRRRTDPPALWDLLSPLSRLPPPLPCLLAQAEHYQGLAEL